MKLAFSSNAFLKNSLSDAIKTVSEIGYDAIEIVLDEPHAFLPLKKENIVDMQDSLKKNSLAISNLNSNTVSGNALTNNPFEPSLSNKNKKMRDWRVSYTKQVIDFAVTVDSPSICVTSGLLNNEDKPEEFDLFLDSLRILASYAETRNIMIAIEYEPGLLVNSSEDVWHIISNDFKNVGLNLDTCHAAINNENMSEIIRKFGKKIFHTHISDCEYNTHFHLIPGLGSIDFAKIYESLKQEKYDGYLTAELYPYCDKPDYAASKAFNYLKNVAK